MKTCILIFNDGRNDYLEQTLKSLFENVQFNDNYKILIDDVPEGRDVAFLESIKKKYKINKLVLNDENLGVFGSVQKAWGIIPKDCTHVWHQENDFLFNEKIDFELMLKASNHKRIFQVALLRQNWFAFEKKAGSIFNAYAGFKDARVADCDLVIHKNFFTHNPCLYRKEFAIQCNGYDEYKYMKVLGGKDANGWCAYLGKTTDGPKVTHIGEIKHV